MNNYDIEKNLKDAVASLVPKDTFEKISMNITPAPEKVRSSMMTNKTNNFKKYMSLAVAACLVIAIGIFGFSYYGNNVAVDSIVDIDVNPSIELSTNKKDVVISAKALNDDAKKVIDGMELKNTDLDVAINAIVGSMLKNGYLDDDAQILVSVLNDDETKADEIKKIVIDDIDKSLNEHNAKNEVLNQTVTDKTEAEKFAEENGISVGKAAYILTLTQRDKALNAKDLAKLSIHQIAEIADERDIDDDDFYDSDRKNNTTTKNSNIITAEKAKEIALNHAGVKAANAKFIKAELDKDDGIQKYEIEFYADKYEYEYEINAVTGKIIKNEKEVERVEKADKNNIATTTSNATNTATISSDKAKEIALNHAGIKSSEVSYIKAEYDYDDGLRKYDVEFRVGNYEYDYEINAVNGKVIDFDKEYEGKINQANANKTTTTKKSSQGVTITAQKAKEIALNHAGVKAADAKYLKAELDKDDGIQKYEVEFKSGKYEYDYEINASTGAVIKGEKEIDN